VLLLILGFFFLFLGKLILKVVVAMTGFIVVFMPTFYLIHLYYPDLVLWIPLCIAIVLGLGAACLALCLLGVFIVLLGAVAGACIGLMIVGLNPFRYNFSSIPPGASSAAIVPFVVMIIGALVGGVLAFIFEDYVIIVMTSIIGAVLICGAVFELIGVSSFATVLSNLVGPSHLSAQIDEEYEVWISVAVVGSGGDWDRCPVRLQPWRVFVWGGC